MLIHFSGKFKQLRKAHDLTQDQIAEIFHVSPQSVSRWETGANYPDIEILPHIARFFKITVDELLGTEAILGEQKAKEYLRDIRFLLNSGKLHDAIETGRRAVKEFPVNYKLQCQLMDTLCIANAESEDDKNKDEIISVGERIIKYCTDQETGPAAKYILFKQYVAWGMKEEARKILHTMTSEIWQTQDVLEGDLLEGEEWRQNRLLQIIRAKNLLCEFIGDYRHKADLEPIREIEAVKTEMQIDCLINSLTGEKSDHVHSSYQNIRIAELYCKANDADSALTYVERATDDSMHHVEIMHQPDENGNNYFPWATPRNLCWILWEDHLIYPHFDIIRSSERFVKCFELLKSNSRELKQTS